MNQTARFLLPFLALLPQPLAAQVLGYDFDFGEAQLTPAPRGSDRLVATHAAASFRAPAPARSAYGPFVVLDASRAALVDATDERTPDAFSAMMRDHPGIVLLEMRDCPGTYDDRANLRLGRMIHARGIATHVPGNGWVASGAVELFLAGSRRSLDPGARFAVHSWEDENGRGPWDYAPDAPKNRAYLDYYRAMGMNEGEAKAFYAMTNSVPFERPRFLSAGEMARWVKLEVPQPQPFSLQRVTLARAVPAYVDWQARF